MSEVVLLDACVLYPAHLSDTLLRLADRAFPQAGVVGHGPLIPSMTNQTKDRHVLAGAITGRATTLLTFSVDGFPEASASPFDIHVALPDDLLLDLLDGAPRFFLHALKTQIAEQALRRFG